MPTNRTVAAEINYQGKMQGRPAYYATDYSRDRLALEASLMRIHDLRLDKGKTSLEAEGFTLVDHKTTVTNFRDDDQIMRIYLPEIARLMQRLTGACKVLLAPHGVLRFSEKSGEYLICFA